jgi:tRNA threonylcarbamoyladenosine biosynthesis protein TsaE
METESVTEILGRRLALALVPGDTLFLEGELGAGKSTLARAILRALGWKGTVRSPSYSLVHTYATSRGVVHHLDLYRLGSVEEALGLDLDELSSGGCLSLVEWPDRLGGSVIPTWRAHLELEGDGRRLELYGPPRSGFESILANLNQEIDA